MKLHALRPVTLLKRDSNTGLICEIFNNTYFKEHLRPTASACSYGFNSHKQSQLTQFIPLVSFYIPWKHRETIFQGV